MATKIAFFDAKSYDRETFGKVNSEYGFEIQYFKERLSMNTTTLQNIRDFEEGKELVNEVK